MPNTPNTQKAQNSEYIDERGFINWWNYAPRDNVVVVRLTPTKIKTQTESGIIIATSEDSEVIAPNYGEVVSQGPDVKEDLIGKIVFFPPQNMFPLAMIKSEDKEIYQMTTADRLDAILVKDVRNK